jgi:RNA polymerase sigma factor (sigma-70 family)
MRVRPAYIHPGLCPFTEITDEAVEWLKAVVGPRVQDYYAKRLVPLVHPDELEGLIVHEAVLRLLKDPDNFDPTKGTLVQWFWGICRHVVLELVDRGWVRQRERERSLPEGNKLEEISLAGAAASDKDVQLDCPAKSWEAEQVDLALSRLSAGEKAVLLASAEWPKGEAPSDEIAAKLGISNGAARTRLCRARAHLKAELIEMGLGYLAAEAEAAEAPRARRHLTQRGRGKNRRRPR